MKGISISSCTSQASTTILSSTIMDPPSSSSSAAVGGRAIDRYNPIITDEKRRGAISKSAPTTPLKTPASPMVVMRGRKKKVKKPSSRSGQITSVTKSVSLKDDGVDHDDNHVRRRSFSKPSDLMTKVGCSVARPGVEYISPPESSRYLLDDTSFLEVLSDFDPVLKLVPYDGTDKKGVGGGSGRGSDGPNKPSSSSSSRSQDQVVNLRVSLHCRGCERKMKKHLSRMPGVRSFNIDFTAKKVTVVGDVTPLEVLGSISKVKNAQLWTPAMSSSFPINSINMQIRK